MNAGILNQALHNPVLNATDRHFARFMERLSGGENPEVALAAAIVASVTEPTSCPLTVAVTVTARAGREPRLTILPLSATGAPQIALSGNCAKAFRSNIGSA